MRAFVAEFLGTAFLLIAIVGSGIMGDRLSGGNVGLALLANALSTGAALVVLILTYGPISGAHFNPLVSLADAMQRRLTWSRACMYVLAQTSGAILGVGAADFMFREPLYMWSQHVRSGAPQLFSEIVATFGLLAVIVGCSRSRPASIPFAVGGYITAAYWFTSSTSFANPAVTAARALTDTFAGIRPVDVAPFVAAQTLGAVLAITAFGWLLSPRA